MPETGPGASQLVPVVEVLFQPVDKADREGAVELATEGRRSPALAHDLGGDAWVTLESERRSVRNRTIECDWMSMKPGQQIMPSASMTVVTEVRVDGARRGNIGDALAIDDDVGVNQGCRCRRSRAR